MQKWFFLEDPSNEALRKGRGDKNPCRIPSDMGKFPHKQWLFRVRVPTVLPGVVVCVSGSVCELGGWAPEKAVPLQPEQNSDVWSAVITIPDGVEIKYRFCECVIVEQGLQAIVRNWESNIVPRIIDSFATTPMPNDEPEIYGDFNDDHRVDRGWLIKETAVQLKLFKNPITIWLPKYANRRLFIKVTPVSLMQHNSNFAKTMSEALEESLSTDTQDVMEMPKHAFTEVASLNESDVFESQEQFGKEYRDDDMLIFQCMVLFPATTAFLLDFFVYSTRCGDGEPPYHAGFSYLLPNSLQGSEGKMVIPITSTKQRPLGELKLEYIIIRPMPNMKCDMSLTYTRHWNQSRIGLDVGHRGAGNSFKEDMKNCAEVRENTIASLKTAINHGADYVEFDVQLSKDLVPIIYHDFHVCISMKSKKQLQGMDMLEIPIKDLTLEQLKMLKVYHLTEGKSKNARFFDEDLEDHQPFPTLRQTLEVLNPHTGFNIEIKWTMERLDESYELYHPTDLNLYLDTILEVLVKYAGNRRIIFSCFNPDICSMIRMKQNKYPVMFLTQGETDKYPKYRDPRCWHIKNAVQHANMIEILGINVHTEDILKDPSYVKMAREANLVIFCWGDENADPITIKYLKELGMHGVIYDKIDQYSSKEIKESIFLIEARECQKDQIRLVAAEAEAEAMISPPSAHAYRERIIVEHVDHITTQDVHDSIFLMGDHDSNKDRIRELVEEVPTPPPTSTQLIRERILDVERARACMENVSTATSLQSLESNMQDYQRNGTKHSAV